MEGTPDAGLTTSALGPLAERELLNVSVTERDAHLSQFGPEVGSHPDRATQIDILSRQLARRARRNLLYGERAVTLRNCDVFPFVVTEVRDSAPGAKSRTSG